MGNSDHSQAALLIQGQPVPVTVFRSGVSPPTNLDLPVAQMDASIPLPGTLGDPPPQMPGTLWHTSTIAQVPPQQACLQKADAKQHLCFLSSDRCVGSKTAGARQSVQMFASYPDHISMAASPIREELAELIKEHVYSCWTHTATGLRFEPDIILLEGSRTTPKGFKLSFHVIIANLIYECNHAGTLHALAYCVHCHLWACRPDWPPMVDLKVYSCNQKYQMPLSSKISDPTGTILTPPGCHTMTRRALLRAL
eukprot:2050165-Rhodomonas_salina.1